jgi:hypothetical protein
MNPDDGKRGTYVSLSSLPTANRWALDSSTPSVQNVGINHRGIDVGVVEQLLNRPDIAA